MPEAVVIAAISTVAAGIAGLWTAFVTEKIVPGSRLRDKHAEYEKVAEALEKARDELWSVKLELSEVRMRREIEQSLQDRHSARTEPPK